MQGVQGYFHFIPKAENKLKKGMKEPRESRVDPVITCTEKARWVASNELYRFQHPAAAGSREACDPHIEVGIPYNEMWVKKRSITHPAGY